MPVVTRKIKNSGNPRLVQPLPATSPARSRSLRAWLAAAVKLLIIVMVLWGIRGTIVSALGDLDRSGWKASRLRPGWLVAAGALYLTGLLPAALFWRRLLRLAGQRPSLVATLRAYYIGHLGKYVPGKAMVVVLRAALVRGPQTTGTVAAVCVFVETLSLMAAGSLVACLILTIRFPDPWWLSVSAAGLMLATGIPTVPAVLQTLVRKFGVQRMHPEALTHLSGLRARNVLPGWIGLAGGWLLSGASLWATFHAAGFQSTLSPGDQWAACTAAAALSIVAGFVLLIPGGLVVREAVVLRLLAPAFGEAGALVAAILSRLVSIVAELAVSCILYSLKNR